MHSEMHWMLNGKMDRTVHRFVYKPLKVGTNLEKKLWLGEGVTEVTFVISGPEVAVKFEKLTVLKLSNPETPH